MKRLNNFRFTATIGFFVLFSFLGFSSLSAQTIWLDQLDLSTATQGYGVPMKNKSIDGKPLTIAGKTFERGFGSHS
ncbi:MAG TPA: NPCBM/NEW2 domain-containing protein, partial [Paludibacter sp.]